jgi:hypothetical protein
MDHRPLMIRYRLAVETTWTFRSKTSKTPGDCHICGGLQKSNSPGENS